MKIVELKNVGKKEDKNRGKIFLFFPLLFRIERVYVFLFVGEKRFQYCNTSNRLFSLLLLFLTFRIFPLSLKFILMFSHRSQGG